MEFFSATQYRKLRVKIKLESQTVTRPRAGSPHLMYLKVRATTSASQTASGSDAAEKLSHGVRLGRWLTSERRRRS